MLDGVVRCELLRVQRLTDLCGNRISDAPSSHSCVSAKPNSLFDFHTVADGAAPRHDRSGIIPWGRWFAVARLDPGVAGRGTCAEIKCRAPHVIDATSSP